MCFCNRRNNKLAKDSTCPRLCLYCQLLNSSSSVCPLSFLFVLLEQGVQDLQGGGDVLRDNILWVHVGQLQVCVIQEVQGQGHIVKHLRRIDRGQVEVTEGDEETFQLSDQQQEDDAICKLLVHVSHLQTHC